VRHYSKQNHLTAKDVQDFRTGAGALVVRKHCGARGHTTSAAKVTFTKLYDRKTPITAADLLNDRVVPFFEKHIAGDASH
jgi:hypothetical protein